MAPTGMNAQRVRPSLQPRLQLLAVALVLASLQLPGEALSNAWCSNPSASGTTCSPCKTPFDVCLSRDGYWANSNLCVLPNDARGTVSGCGPSQTLPLALATGEVAGRVTVFQASTSWLMVTYQVLCPYVLRVGTSTSATAPYSAGLLVAAGSTGVSPASDPQYVDLFPQSGTWTCVTFYVNLGATCDASTSQFSFSPLAALNQGCACLAGPSLFGSTTGAGGASSTCPPQDLRAVPVISLVPTVYAMPAGSNCVDSLSAPLLLSAVVPNATTGGVIAWQPHSSCPSTATPSPPPSTPPFVFKPAEQGNTAPPIPPVAGFYRPPVPPGTASPPPLNSNPPPAVASPPPPQNTGPSSPPPPATGSNNPPPPPLAKQPPPASTPPDLFLLPPISNGIPVPQPLSLFTPPQPESLFGPPVMVTPGSPPASVTAGMLGAAVGGAVGGALLLVGLLTLGVLYCRRRALQDSMTLMQSVTDYEQPYKKAMVTPQSPKGKLKYMSGGGSGHYLQDGIALAGIVTSSPRKSGKGVNGSHTSHGPPVASVTIVTAPGSSEDEQTTPAGTKQYTSPHTQGHTTQMLGRTPDSDEFYGTVVLHSSNTAGGGTSVTSSGTSGTLGSGSLSGSDRDQAPGHTLHGASHSPEGTRDYHQSTRSVSSSGGSTVSSATTSAGEVHIDTGAMELLHHQGRFGGHTHGGSGSHQQGHSPSSPRRAMVYQQQHHQGISRTGMPSPGQYKTPYPGPMQQQPVTHASHSGHTGRMSEVTPVRAPGSHHNPSTSSPAWAAALPPHTRGGHTGNGVTDHTPDHTSDRMGRLPRPSSDTVSRFSLDSSTFDHSPSELALPSHTDQQSRASYSHSHSHSRSAGQRTSNPNHQDIYASASREAASSARRGQHGGNHPNAANAGHQGGGLSQNGHGASAPVQTSRHSLYQQQQAHQQQHHQYSMLQPTASIAQGSPHLVTLPSSASPLSPTPSCPNPFQSLSALPPELAAMFAGAAGLHDDPFGSHGGAAHAGPPASSVAQGGGTGLAPHHAGVTPTGHSSYAQSHSLSHLASHTASPLQHVHGGGASAGGHLSTSNTTSRHLLSGTVPSASAARLDTSSTPPTTTAPSTTHSPSSSTKTPSQSPPSQQHHQQQQSGPEHHPQQPSSNPNNPGLVMHGSGDASRVLASSLSWLQPGVLLYGGRYRVESPPVCGRHSVVVHAVELVAGAGAGSCRLVALKFYSKAVHAEREAAVLRRLLPTYVPELLDVRPPTSHPFSPSLPSDPPQAAAPSSSGRTSSSGTPATTYSLPHAIVLERGTITLGDWLATHKPDVGQRVTALHQVACALAHLHAAGLVHRDLKPANIMYFEGASSFKLIDLAEAVGDGAPAPPACTPLYSAPELLQAAMSGAPTVGVTPAADLWSFGVILYEALTGRRFYGTAPSTRVVLEAALGGSHLPTEVTNPGDPLMAPEAGPLMAAARQLVCALVRRAPAERLSAVGAARHELFTRHGAQSQS